MSILDGMCHKYFDPDTAFREPGGGEDSRVSCPYDRVFVVVLDSLGIGAASDAEEFGDAGADTLGHICEKHSGLDVPNLRNLGIANLKQLAGVDPVDAPTGKYARLMERSASKDTMAGHWEMMCLETTSPFATFPNGFPKELVDELERRCGHKTIGNKVASGTVILDELGRQSIEEESLILYTSADSVLQLAASEEAFGLDELYRCCEIARALTMRDGWKVGRVIARPFTGSEPGKLERTSNRRDYTVEPTGTTALDVMKEAGLDVIGVGKIGDIFSMRGLTESLHSDSSVRGMQQAREIASKTDWQGMCFVNLVDFDSKWGHRRDPEGYAEEIERFDVELGKLMEALGERDLLLLTADHGNDPTYPGSDHTREDVFLLAWSPSMESGGCLGERSSFGAIGATVLDNFGLNPPGDAVGESLLREIST